MTDITSSREFLNRLNAGDESAAAEVYDRYADRLCQKAAGMIGERLGRQYSPEDAAHSALASFFRGMNKGRYDVECSGRLWALLMTIMKHKIQKRGKRAKDGPLAVELVDGEPPHEDVVELADAIEAAMAEMKPRHLEICRLFYQEDCSSQEIVAQVGCSRWTVRRVLDEFGARLTKSLGNGCKS